MNAMWMAWWGMAAGVAVFGWAWQRAGERGRRWLDWGLVLLVAVVSAASAALHEPWRDELHAWLLAREMGVGELWREMAYEGHFLPWFLLLRPLAHWGAPIWTMGAVSWALNAIAVWWLARRSPMTGWEKAAAGLSCLFLYVNPAIARPYALVPLALWGMASLWGKRDDRPVSFGLWVALLANTHAYLEGVAGAAAAVFAWENVWRRKDGMGWTEGGRQWAGLGVMAAGGLAAAAQVVPGLWKSELTPGPGQGPGLANALDFFAACPSGWAAMAVTAGMGWLGVETWKRDRGAFWVYAGGLGFMLGFAVVLYSAGIVNRALLWWPLALWGAWVAAGCSAKEGGGKEAHRSWGRVLAVVAMGVGTMRPDMTWLDWREEYDVLPGVCRWVEEEFGEDAEVWIDASTEVAWAYLGNAMDRGTGEKARPVSWAKDVGVALRGFEESRRMVFGRDPGKESVLALGSMEDWSGMSWKDAERPGVEVLLWKDRSICPWIGGVAVVRAWRWGKEWEPTGVAKYAAGDREGAVAAWKRAVREDGGAWGAMNNLAWAALEDGRTAEAREWIDRAMGFEEARENPGARDTEREVERRERAGEWERR
jgi:hypothetical protein